MNNIISPPSKWVSEMIARIEPGGTLIDIACGRGRHSIEFSKNFFIYSVDKNNEFLNNLKNNLNIKMQMKKQQMEIRLLLTILLQLMEINLMEAREKECN